MKKFYFFLPLLVASLFLIGAIKTNAATPASQFKGLILLQTDSQGEAWYVNPGNLQRYFLATPEDAQNLIKKVGIGAKHSFFEKETFAPHNLGRIYIDVEENGKAYYIYPKDKKAYYLGSMKEALIVWKSLGQATDDAQLNQIEEAAGVGNIEDAWRAYDKYVDAVMARDFEALQEMAYEKLDLKKDCAKIKMKQTECKNFYLNLLFENFGTDPKIDRATSTVYKDNRQILIVSPQKREQEDQFVTVTQQTLMLVKNKRGDWKLLKISYDSKARFISEGETVDIEKLYQEMEAQLIDQDHDGLSDYTEQGNDFFSKPGTNYLIADTDKDGWWDGIEIAAKKKPLNKWNKLFY